MTEHVVNSQDVGTRFCGALVVALGGFMVFISLIVSYDILFSQGFGWTASAILTVVVFWGVVLLWGPIILLICIVMQSLCQYVRSQHVQVPHPRLESRNMEQLRNAQLRSVNWADEYPLRKRHSPADQPATCQLSW